MLLPLRDAVVVLATGVVCGALLGYILVGSLLPPGASPFPIWALTVVSAPTAALSGAAVISSLSRTHQLGFFGGAAAAAVAWPVFCVLLGGFTAILLGVAGWLYGMAVFTFGIVFGIAPAIVVLGGLAGFAWSRARES